MTTQSGTLTPVNAATLGRQMLNKVPEVTLWFWVIKVVATTVGETAADFLTGTVGLSLGGATWVVGAALVATLAVQFRARRYIPAVYWLAVVLVSVVGTLITDNLVDDLGVALTTTTIVFAAALAATFALWFASERTLSIHTIVTTRREAFYWTAILFTFALGTAAGDLLAEGLKLGYSVSGLVFAAAIALIAVAHKRFGLGAVLAFWMAYVITRPLGASVGDLLSQPTADGGVGLGTVVTSALFLLVIVGAVSYLAVSKRDVTSPDADMRPLDGVTPGVGTAGTDRSSRLVLAGGVGAALSVAVAVIHVLDQGGLTARKDPGYLGYGYWTLEVVGVVAAVVLLTRHRMVGWLLAAGVATGPLLGIIVSRSVGLPGATDDIGNWGEPLGVAAMAVETTLLVLALTVVSQTARLRPRVPSRS